MIKKTQFIKDLKRDDLVNDIFVVKFKKPVEPYQKGFKFEIRIGDGSKEIMCKVWGPPSKEEVQKTYDSIQNDGFIRIKGQASEWKNILEIAINDLHNIQLVSTEDVDISEFIPSSKKDINQMFEELMDYVNSVENPQLKKVLTTLFEDKKFAESFKKSTASMYKHHNWVGGLLEHTLGVVTICSNTLKVHTNLDRDLVITGAIIHDIGKIEEFKITTNIKVGNEGMLLGHLIMGYEKISKLLDTIEIDHVLAIKIKHIILSHHGKLEYGSPKTPAFPEALLIYYADEMDAKLNQIQATKHEANTEDDYIFTKDFGNVYLK